jgi:hypothetical protein
MSPLSRSLHPRTADNIVNPFQHIELVKPLWKETPTHLKDPREIMMTPQTQVITTLIMAVDIQGHHHAEGRTNPTTDTMTDKMTSVNKAKHWNPSSKGNP